LNEPTPNFVVIGHICQDLLPDGGRNLGGSVSYAATTALRLGYRVGVVTSTGPEMAVDQALPGAQVVCHRAAETTVFENIYHNGERTQYLHSRAGVLTCDHVPAGWRSAPLVYIGSIDQEIDESVFHCFSPETLVGVMPQGFFRRWDEGGQIHFVEWNPSSAVLARINLLVISELDVPDPRGLARAWGQSIDVVAITHAERGATIYQGGESCHYPARPADQVDPTGAGDVFAAAYLISLAEIGDACQAAAFANATASFSVEGPGVAGIPRRATVEEYLRSLPER
jgi:sugar/nucleoside kinase (ribokinase family)